MRGGVRDDDPNVVLSPPRDDPRRRSASPQRPRPNPEPGDEHVSREVRLAAVPEPLDGRLPVVLDAEAIGKVFPAKAEVSKAWAEAEEWQQRFVVPRAHKRDTKPSAQNYGTEAPFETYDGTVVVMGQNPQRQRPADETKFSELIEFIDATWAKDHMTAPYLSLIHI